MKTLESKRLWLYFPKVLFVLAGLLCIFLIIYGSQLTNITYRFDDVKRVYANFLGGDAPISERQDNVMVKSMTDDLHLDDSQKLAVDWVSVYRETPYQGAKVYTDFTIKQKKLRPLNNITPLKPEFGIVVNDVTEFTYISEPKSNCKISDKPTLFIAIVSAPGNQESRNAIRETWLQQLTTGEWSQFTVAGAAFLVGEPEQHYEQTVLSSEANDHGDILQVKMRDQFSDLSKKVASLFNWLHKNCLEVDYLLKVDDDVYVNPFNIAKLLSMKKPDEPTMYGTGIGNPPSREGRWAISYEEWPWNEYPRYITTAGVIMTGNSITPLLAAFQTTPFMRFDDIYLTGICKETANIKVVTTTRMNGRGVPKESDPCMIFNTVTWVTGAGDRIRTWHSYTNDFYSKVSTCSIDGSTVDPSAVDFLFIT